MRSVKKVRERGVTLLELMIAMAILAIALVALTQMHVVGVTSTGAARRHTSAVSIAGELAGALERLAFTDGLVSSGPASATPPTPFGQLVAGDGTIATGPNVHEWSDAAPVPGVRLRADVREMADSVANYQRRWTVWNDARSGQKLIAVSVTWNDPPFSRPREVVQYTYIGNPGIIGTALGSTP
jgi:prepilin-type N-terminal cleavage/methylation domain-containing protein